MRQFAWILAVTMAGVAAPAAQSEQPAAPAQKPVFHSGVDLVRFDLSVTDENGKPLPDVRPDEIEIDEDGKPLPIVLFQRVQEPAGLYRDAAVRAVSAEVTSNVSTPRGHLYIFVFDQNHIASGNEQRAREAARTFIRTRVRPTDRIAMFGIPGPGPDLQFTSDPQRALAELDEVRGDLDRTVTTALGRISVQEAYDIAAGDETMADRVMQRLESDLSADVGGTSATATSVDRGATQFFNEDHATKLKIMQENARAVVQHDEATTRDFLARLSKLMTQFRNIEGRKTLILFSEGFNDQNVSRDLQDVAAAAAESYCVFYSLDISRRLADLAGAVPESIPAATEIQSRTSPLASLALETDGIYVNDASSRLDEVLTRIADQSQDYYIAGFLPSAKALAERGSYRRVTVKVKRPGARVSARTGYAVPSNTTPLDRRAEIDAALAAPFSQQALKVAYTTYVLRSGTNGHPRVVLSLGADLPLRDDTHDAADVVFVVRDAHDGHVAASGTDTIPLPDKPEPGSYLGHGTYRVQFEVPPGNYLMRAVVREPGGLLGSADRRLDVRNVSGPSVVASDLVLGSADGALPVRAEAYTNSGLNGALEVYGRTAEQLAGVKVQVSLSHENGGATRTVEAQLGNVEDVAGGTLRRATFSVPLDGLEPGAYVARAVVRDGAEEVESTTRQLDVVAGRAPIVAGPPVDPLNVAHGQLFERAKGEWVTAPAEPAAHANRGFDLFVKGDFATAASELQQAFNANQKSAATAFVLGWAWEGTGNEEKAIGAWRAAAEADPTLVPAHLAIADAYLRLAKPALAVQALRAGLAAAPDSVELKAKLGQIVGSR